MPHVHYCTMQLLRRVAKRVGADLNNADPAVNLTTPVNPQAGRKSKQVQQSCTVLSSMYIQYSTQ